MRFGHFDSEILFRSISSICEYSELPLNLFSSGGGGLCRVLKKKFFFRKKNKTNRHNEKSKGDEGQRYLNIIRRNEVIIRKGIPQIVSISWI